MKNSLPSVIIECILPIHAFLGCDNISRVYSIERVKSITEDLREQENASASSKVNKKDAEKASIARKGEELLFNLMKVGQELSLN